MSTFAPITDLPTLDGLTCKQLTAADTQAIMNLQAEMLAALPDPSWYYPSSGDVFAACCQRGEVFGFWADKQLAGFGILTPWYIRPTSCYAVKAGDEPMNTFDFQDVMVAPAYRRRGIHKALLQLFERLTLTAGGRALYCTIAPQNLPSIQSFQKAGFTCICEQPAYEGMLRGYYRKVLI